MDVTAATTLPVLQAGQLPSDHDGSTRWLVEYIWTEQAVGVIGGIPKLGKTWVGLDLALSVASSTLCFERFEVHQPGRALVYLAEDGLPQVRQRLAALCQRRQLALDSTDLHVITAPTLRLDLDADQQRLEATVAQLKPVLLVLDPLVRLHRLDENSSADISALLGYLRGLQRTHGVAVALVHHMSKRRRADLGQALRGSGDIHAWSDSSAYLVGQRENKTFQLTLEHRAALAPDPIRLRLVHQGDEAHLQVVEEADVQPTTSPLTERIRQTLARASAPQPRVKLRDMLRVNNHRLGKALVALERRGVIEHRANGWSLKLPSNAGHDPQRELL